MTKINLDMTENNGNLTSLENLGEFGLIDRLTKDITTNQESTIKGIGDDAAIIKNEDHTVVSTDMFVEGIHFDLSYSALKHLGYKAVIANISDIYAMNATPRQITVAISISNRFTLEAVEELYSGIKLACSKYNIDLIGGDTTSSTSGMTICITAIGSAPKEKLTYRSGAKKNDILCISGDIGAAYMGLQLLKREKEVFKVSGQQPDFVGYEYILERQLKPEARKDVIEALAEAGVKPTSMIDISDGLASDALQICKSSDVGMKIFEDKIPIGDETEDMAKELNLETTTCAINGGEDFELLFTIDIRDYEKVKNHQLVIPIGHVTNKEEGSHLVARAGNFVELTAQGFK